MKTSLPEALFLDRDGTLIKWVDYLHEPSEVVLEPGIGQALLKAKKAGCRLFLHTNQSGVGRGYFSEDAVHAVNAKMFELLGVEESFFDAICIATDSPDQVGEDSYRKPSPRFGLEMIEQFGLDSKNCFYVGDNESDILAGINAGMRSVWVESQVEKAGNRGEAKRREVLYYATLVEFIDKAL